MILNLDRRVRVAVVLVLAMTAGGCGWNAFAPAANAPEKEGSLADDACADLLHDLIGDLLEYYALHGKLPAAMGDLGSGPSPIPLACPVSRTAYVYDPRGIAVPGWPGRLILYDAVPVHGGRRYGILAEQPHEGKPIFFRVVRPPESVFEGRS